MGISSENQDLGRGPAEPCFTPKAIHATLSGTETAVLKDAISFLDSLSQDALVLQFLIGWPPSLFLFLHGMKGERRQKQGASQEKGTLDETPACNLHTRHVIITGNITKACWRQKFNCSRLFPFFKQILWIFKPFSGKALFFRLKWFLIRLQGFVWNSKVKERCNSCDGIIIRRAPGIKK
jgi:hypothetical protein